MGIAYNTSIVRDGLVLHLDAANVKSYPGSGTVWKDLSGLGNDGTLVNGPTYDSLDNGSLLFDGTNDYGTINLTPPFTSDFAILVWVYKFNNTSNDYVWDFGANGGTLSAGTDVGGYGFRYYNGITGNTLYREGPVPNINEWYNVTISRSSSVTSMYVNGNFITSASDTRSITSSTLHLGRYGGSTGYELDGKLSTICIYNRALSAVEIKQNFESLRGRYGI